jgi:dipeptidyl aminopeptidase/acylaminoacyl peptidase
MKNKRFKILSIILIFLTLLFFVSNQHIEKSVGGFITSIFRTTKTISILLERSEPNNKTYETRISNEITNEVTISPQPSLPPWVISHLLSGNYLFYVDNKGLNLASESGKNSFLLAPIIDGNSILSPNKMYVAYSKAGMPMIYDITTNTENSLHYENGICITPEWSPDSQKIIFSCQQGEGRDLVEFSLTNNSVTRINDCEQDKFFCEMPKWSPDGKLVAYIRYPAYSGYSEDSGLYILDTKCILEKNCESGYGPFPFMNAYAWSNDSTHLAGISNNKLYIYSYNEGKLSINESLGEIGTGESIVWSPEYDGLAISPIDGKAYSFRLKSKELIPFNLPNNIRIRGWIHFP